ncbi:Hypp1249 [Branchiostoma lanceolatum]|uniref:Hypp1249 protein n=1 Tax=Branchiostoma lanceolatum TaxID=7740 RepID=A0A8K0EMM8_BRALA|nr:Hypp1249 [Branchiostoma lanceolatum]
MSQEQAKEETADEFGLRMVETVSSGFVTLAISMGVRTGLFSHLARMDGPKTSAQIADTANMKERYVREWLAVMVTGQIVEYDKEQKTFFLPKHRMAALLPDAGINSIGTLSHLMSQLAPVSGDVSDCFPANGPKGLPYSAYPEFHASMGGMREMQHKTSLVDNFLPTIPGLREDLESGIRVLDVACGRGITTLILAQHFPNSNFVGTDLCEDAIQWPTEEVTKRGLANVTFQVQDLAKMPADWSDSFDYVLVWDAVHDQADPDRALREIFRMVKSGGRFSMVDIRGHTELADNMRDPASPAHYGISLLHCMTVSLYFGGRGLGTRWGQELASEMLQEAGFADIQLLDVPNSPSELHFLCKKS